jgi:hypothetical protein
MQGIPDVMSKTMRKRTMQQISGLVLFDVFLNQDREDLLSAQILKTCPPAGAGNGIAQAKARNMFMMTPMSSSELM